MEFELDGHHFRVKKAPIAPGTYRNITGNEATALGLVAASQLSGLVAEEGRAISTR